MDFLGIKAAWNDFDNYRDWKRTIRAEEANSESTFNNFNMGRNYFFNVYVVVTLPGEDAVLPEEVQKMRVYETIRPINNYLDNQLKFAEYLTPEFSRVIQDGQPTLSFLVVYKFTFHKLSIKWILWRLGGLAALTTAGFQVPWTNLFTWISNLI